MNFQVIYHIIILILTTCFWCDLISCPLQENNYIIIDTIFNKIINKENYFNSPVNYSPRLNDDRRNYMAKFNINNLFLL